MPVTMNAFTRAVDTADRFQRRHLPLAFPVAVWKKFTDDQAGNLAALVAYYAFAALFPLLLVLATVLNITLSGNPALHKRLLSSALAEYPVIGPQINSQLGSIGGSGIALTFGIVLLLLGARGVAGAMQNAICSVWGIPKDRRPGFPKSVLQGMALVLFIGIGFIVTTSLSGVAGGTGHLLSGWGAHIGAIAVSLVLNVGMFWVGFRLATGLLVPWRDLRVGAAIAAAVWQVLQVVGGYVISHQLHRSSELYGTFGVVLGLLAWLYLQAEVTIYAAEIDVVMVRRLWPRSIAPDESSEPASPAVPASSAEAASPVDVASPAKPSVPAQPGPPAPARNKGRIGGSRRGRNSA